MIGMTCSDIAISGIKLACGKSLVSRQASDDGSWSYLRPERGVLVTYLCSCALFHGLRYLEE